MKNKILYLPVNKYYFNLIKNKELKEDFRAIKKYWIKKLIQKDYMFFEPIDIVRAYYDNMNVFNHFEYVVFQIGYDKNSPSITTRFNSLRFTSPNEETCMGIGIAFAIKFSYLD